jgi:hypothetical protein
MFIISLSKNEDEISKLKSNLFFYRV